MKRILLFGLYFLIFTMISAAASPDEWDSLFSSGFEASDSADSYDDVILAGNEEDFFQPELKGEPAEVPPHFLADLLEIEQPSARQPLNELSREANPVKPPSEAPPHREPPQPPVRTIIPALTFIFPPAAPAPPVVYERPQKPMPQAPQTAGMRSYRIQAGAFSNPDNAWYCFMRLQSAGFSPLYEQYGGLWRVIIAGVKAADVAWTVKRLQTAGFTDVWIRGEK
jgi:cell division protein FtsN